MPYPGSHYYDETFESEDVTPDSSFMFATQQPHTQSSTYPTSTHDSPHSWPPFDQTLLPPFQSQPLPYRSFPSPAPYTAPRLSSPLSTAGGGHVGLATNVSRLSLAGSLDPATGIFYRTPEHPRLRTAQACEKCRTRKAKCTGEHPSCKRCRDRGLVCEYAKEGRVRGPNKVKNTASTSNSSLKHPSASGSVDLEQGGRASSSSVEPTGVSSLTSPTITTSEPPIRSVLSEEHSPSMASLDTLTIQSPPRVNYTPLSQHLSPHPGQISQDLYSLSTSAASSGPSSRRNSLTPAGVGLGEHRASRPRPPDLGLDADGNWRQGTMGRSNSSGWLSSQTNAAVNLTDLGELPMDLQNTQQQYERHCFVRQQHQRYLQEQQRIVAYQQHRLQHHGTPVQMDYQDLQSQPSSLPLVPALHRGMNPAMDSMFQTQYQAYTPTGDLSSQRTMVYAEGLHSEMQTQGYQGESQAASTMTHQESFQRASTGLESAEQGLHPSLSRVEKRMDSFVGASNREEHSIGTCPSGVNQGRQGIDSGDQSRWV